MSSAKQVSFTELCPKVAYEFFDIISESESVKIESQALALKKRRIQADGEVINTQDNSEAARLIAQKLKEIGDKMEGSLPDEVKTQIEEQCSNIQLPSSMVYEQFSGVYRRFFESAKERIDNAWQKIYLVYHGAAVLNNEWRRQDEERSRGGESRLVVNGDSGASTGRMNGRVVADGELDALDNEATHHDRKREIAEYVEKLLYEMGLSDQVQLGDITDSIGHDMQVHPMVQVPVLTPEKVWTDQSP